MVYVDTEEGVDVSDDIDESIFPEDVVYAEDEDEEIDGFGDGAFT